MQWLTVEVGKDKVPYKVFFIWQPYRAEETLDTGVISPEVLPYVDIDHTNDLCGYSVDDLLSGNAMEKIRKAAHEIMIKRSEQGESE
jgi:hypothetical protein